MASYKVEVIPSPACDVGEGPHWDIGRQCLYYVDIFGSSLHRYDYKTNKLYSATIDNVPLISFIIPVKGHDKRFVIGDTRKVSIIEWDGESSKAKIVGSVGDVESGPEKNQFNDGKIDPRGRLYAGTMKAPDFGNFFSAWEGSLYRFSKNAGFIPLKSKICISNGLTWDVAKNIFYYIDSGATDVKGYDYNPETGEISNERVIIDFRVNGERPEFLADGMTIDTEGNLYVALFGGGSVLKIDPSTGQILMDIKIPAEQVTSLAFGGPKLDILYVTSAAKEIKTPQPPPAGSIFKITGLGATGIEMQRFDPNAV